MAKTIVTHINPDLDAISASWLLTRFGGEEFREYSFAFVPAGERLKEEDQNTVHVDTGLGEFDHHQPERGKEKTCAAQLVYDWLIRTKKIPKREELKRLVSTVCEIDHFGEYFWPEPASDRYEFFLAEMLNGIKAGGQVRNDEELLKFGMQCLDGVLTAFKIRLASEEDIKRGFVFQTRWGKALAIESGNSGVMKLALKKEHVLVVRRDPERGFVRIKAAPLEEIDLTPVFKRLKQLDPKATWYFHPGGKMVLNGSTRNPVMTPSTLSLDEVVEAVKQSVGEKI